MNQYDAAYGDRKPRPTEPDGCDTPIVAGPQREPEAAAVWPAEDLPYGDGHCVS